MEEAKRRIRIVMICIVLTAVVVGIVYYYHETQNHAVLERGTLIAAQKMRWHSWLQ